MHMQQGIGRAGFTLLALVTFAIGAFGFALAWTAFTQGAATFFQMGLGVAAVALLALFLFAAFRPTATSTTETPVAAPASTPAPRAAPAATADVGFEFDDYAPAAKAAPEELVLPQAFKEAPPTPTPDAAVEFKPVNKSLDTAIEQVVEAAAPAPTSTPTKDPAAWPGARGKSSWTNQVEHRRKVESQVGDANRRHELAEKYTRTTPTLRAILDDGVPPAKQAEAKPDVPEKLADRAPGDMNTDFVAPGMSVGQCGQCKTLLLAPEERPLRLKCPECAKVTLLQ